jgi:hypothetical protein
MTAIVAQNCLITSGTFGAALLLGFWKLKGFGTARRGMKLVRKAGLEPAWLAPPPPQDGVSANSTTSAFKASSTTTVSGGRRDFSTRNRHQSKELIGAVKALAEPEMPGDSELEA